MDHLVRNIVLGVLAVFGATLLGPPLVRPPFLLAIEYFSENSQAIVPLPPMPVATPQATFTTPSMPAVATMTNSNDGQWPLTIYPDSFGPSSQGKNYQRQNLPYRLSAPFNWCSRIFHQVAQASLLCLRNLLDSFLYQVGLSVAIFVSWRLLRRRNLAYIENIMTIHEAQFSEIQEEAMAKGTEIASLKTQLESQKLQLDENLSLLDKASKKIEAMTLAEDQSRRELATLSSTLIDRDNTIADRDRSVDEATKKAGVAEESYRALDKTAKKSRSDLTSALQKKENEIAKHRRACEQAVKDGDAARRELKDARSQVSKDKKRITELEAQVANSAKKTSELEAQVQEKDRSLGRKDGEIANMRNERQKLTKDLKNMTSERDRLSKLGSGANVKDKKLVSELQARVTEANNLRRAAEAKASEQEKLAVEAVNQRKLAEASAVEQKESSDKQLKSKDEQIEVQKEEKTKSCGYLQRLLDNSSASNTHWHAEFHKERAKAQEAGSRAQETEKTLQERIATLEAEVRSLSLPPTIIATSSAVASPEPSSPSPSPRPVVRIPGADAVPTAPKDPAAKPGPRFMPPLNGTTKMLLEERGLPANTPTGPTKMLLEERGLPANTPTGPKGGRGGNRR